MKPVWSAGLQHTEPGADDLLPPNGLQFRDERAVESAEMPIDRQGFEDYCMDGVSSTFPIFVKEGKLEIH
jgi:hypothetical protein